MDNLKLLIIYLAIEVPYERTVIKITHDETVVCGPAWINI